MTIPVWQPGTTYVPGALVVPRTTSVTPPSVLANVGLTDTTGWDDIEGVGAAIAIDTTTGYVTGEGQFALTAVSSGAYRFNNVKLEVVPGQTISASVMVRHTTGDKQSSDGTLHFIWLDKNGNATGAAAHGTGLPSLSSSGWQRISLSAAAPANAASVKIGVFLISTGADQVYASHLQVNGYAVPISPRAVMFEATQATPGKSGSTEPIWPGLGGSVQDNQVTWNGVNIDRVVWQASPLLQSGGVEPVWPTVPGGVVHDGTVDWIAVSPVITDPNCPHSKIVTMDANKIFAGDGDITRYCATNDATDWSSEQDAGYLPTGLKAIGETQGTALAIYRANLAAWTASSLQIWQTDPDPANMAFIDAVIGGTTYLRTPAAMANDLYFLSPLGVRSVSVTATTGTMGGTDVGSPVDPPVQAALNAYQALVAAGTPPSWEPIAITYPNLSQYWVILGAEAYVYALSVTAKVSAWQHYTFPFTVTDAAVKDGQLYVRTDANDLWVLDETLFADDGADYDVEMQLPWLDFGSPGVQKLFVGVDAVIAQGGTDANTFVSVGWDENNVASLTPEVAISNDTQPGTVIAIPAAGPTFSIKLRNSSTASWECSAITAYYENMRATS